MRRLLALARTLSTIAMGAAHSSRPLARGAVLSLGGRDPRVIARCRGRDYLTPEDITEAARLGISEVCLFRIVLEMIGSKRAEDPSLCAFVAVNRRPKKKRPAEKESTDR